MSTLIPTKSDVFWFLVILGGGFGSLVLSIMKDRGEFAPLAEVLMKLM